MFVAVITVVVCFFATAVETIAVPQAERDGKAIDAIHADLLRRYPANFTST